MMTFKELKAVVKVADERKPAPKHKELLEMGVNVVVKEVISDGVEITVFENGYVLFADGKRKTVFKLHECEGVDYESVKDKSVIFQSTFFENENWYVLLLLVGMERLEKNLEKQLADHKVYSSDSIGLADFYVTNEPDALHKIIEQETIEEIRTVLTEKQMYAMTAYYCEGISQIEISKNLGISQQAASKLIKRSIQEIREVMHIEETVIKRTRNKK